MIALFFSWGNILMSISPVAGSSFPIQSLSRQPTFPTDFQNHGRVNPLNRLQNRFLKTLNSINARINQSVKEAVENRVRASDNNSLSSQAARLASNHDSFTYSEELQALLNNMGD